MDYCSIESRALKSSFISRMALKTNSQPLLDDDDIDRWCFAGINGVAGDDFPVEDLLNLDFQTEGSFSEEDEEQRVSVSRHHCHSSSSSISSASGDFDDLLAGELSVPTDELENLEWLSQFVDDSSPEISILFSAGNLTEKARERSNRKTPVACFPVPRKSRSKRSRGTGRAWPMTSSSMSTTSSSSHDSSTLDPVQDSECFSSVEDPPAKKQKKKPAAGIGSLAQPVRRCTHCLVQKTPQWRTGPLGPKTLCNACGVRYKSGRLLPEYRPACSPTFSREIHSNSHRKVLQMRQKKELSGLVEPGVTRMVPSF